MSPSAILLDSSSKTHSKYIVFFQDDVIVTTLTNDSNVVHNWLDDTERIHHSTQRIHHFEHHNKLIVGLNVEWAPTFRRGVIVNRIAILQLCVGSRCLIYQLFRHNGIPPSLVDFLVDPDYTFVGVGIHDDVPELSRNYGLWVNNAVNLQELAADVHQDNGFLNMGLKDMTDVVLERELDKPKKFTLSNWGLPRLNDEQVVYASLDAYASYEIGRVLKLHQQKLREQKTYEQVVSCIGAYYSGANGGLLKLDEQMLSCLKSLDALLCSK